MAPSLTLPADARPSLTPHGLPQGTFPIQSSRALDNGCKGMICNCSSYIAAIDSTVVKMHPNVPWEQHAPTTKSWSQSKDAIRAPTGVQSNVLPPDFAVQGDNVLHHHSQQPRAHSGRSTPQRQPQQSPHIQHVCWPVPQDMRHAGRRERHHLRACCGNQHQNLHRHTRTHSHTDWNDDLVCVRGLRAHRGLEFWQQCPRHRKQQGMML